MTLSAERDPCVSEGTCASLEQLLLPAGSSGVSVASVWPNVHLDEQWPGHMRHEKTRAGSPVGGLV